MNTGKEPWRGVFAEKFQGLGREILKIFRKRVEKLADVPLLARGGGFSFTNEDLETLLGLHLRLRFFHTGSRAPFLACGADLATWFRLSSSR